MSIRIIRAKEPTSSKKNMHRSKHKNQFNNSSDNDGSISDSYFFDDTTTLPLIYLESEIQQREFHRPGLSMGSINILEENDPNVIKEYLTGLIDLPTNLLNADSGHEGGESMGIDMEGHPHQGDASTRNANATWTVSEVAVSPPSVVYSGESQYRKTILREGEPQVNETTMPPKVEDEPKTAMWDMIDEFSTELEKKLKDSGMGDFDLPDRNDFYDRDYWKFKRIRKVKDDNEKQTREKRDDYKSKVVAQSALEERPEPTVVPVGDSAGDYVVDDVLLIYNNGTLLFHARRQSDVQIDDDLFSGMLTAVKDFVKDSFGARDGGGLKRMDFGINKVLIEYGRNVYLTTILKGGEPAYLPLYMMQVLKEVEEKYSPVLEKWDGRLEKLAGVNDVVTNLLEVTNESTHEIEGFESGAVASTIKLIERAKTNGMPASNPEVFAQNITRAIEDEGYTNAWNYLKKTEWELIRHFGEMDIRGDAEDTTEPEDGLPEPGISYESEADNEMAELEHTINGMVELMDELDSEKRGTDEERAKLREMVQELENRMADYGGGAEGTNQDRSELRGVVGSVLERMNEIRMDKMDADMEKAELDGAIKGIEDKITEFEISQIGTEAERTELKRMVDGIEEKIAQMESGNIESDGAKSELKGEIEGAKAKMEDMVKGVEEKMAEMEIKIQGTEDKMGELEDEVEELEGEIEVRRFTLEYIKNLDNRGELESLCQEAGLSTSGNVKELKNRLLSYVEGLEPDSGIPTELEDERFTEEYIENVATKAELVELCQDAGMKKSGRKEELRERLLQYVKEREAERNTVDSDTKPAFRMEGVDNLVYAVMGDMYKHLSMELGDSVHEFAEELEIFIRAVLETREGLGMGADDILKSVAIKPYNEKTGEVLTKLRTEFLSKVKAEDLEVVKPDEEWEGIKLTMEPNTDLIATTFKTQATKVMMLLNLQSPLKIKQILEEKGEYSLGVEGYMVTITPEMMTFRTSTPENFEIRELENGVVYIDREIIVREDEEEPPPPPPEPKEDNITEEPEPIRHIPETPEPSRPGVPEPTAEEIMEPPPPSDYIQKPNSPRKRKGRLFGKLKKRLSR